LYACCCCAEEAEARYTALQQQMEQERRDHELALRLAAESRGGVIEEMVVKRADSIGGRVGKNPVLQKKKNQPNGFFGLFLVFCFCLVFWFFYIFAQKREFFKVFSVSRILLGASRL
jgi:hypothetical protein